MSAGQSLASVRIWSIRPILLCCIPLQHVGWTIGAVGIAGKVHGVLLALFPQHQRLNRGAPGLSGNTTSRLLAANAPVGRNKSRMNHLGRQEQVFTAPGRGPFDPARPFHATAVADRICVKGAPEEISLRCTRLLRRAGVMRLGEAERRVLLDQTGRLAARGLRVLLVAEGPLDATLTVRPLRDLLGLAAPTPMGWGLIGTASLAAVAISRSFSPGELPNAHPRPFTHERAGMA